MEVKDLRSKVSRHFYDLVGENANPLVVALALQDNSSVGLQRHTSEFYELHEMIREFLRARVDESYSGFMESAGVYRYVVEALKTSNEGLQGSKQQLLDVHGQLEDRKLELRDLHRKSIIYKRKLEVLGNLEMLQQLPAKYEACVLKKEFTKAQQMLENVLEVFNQHSLLNHPSIQPMIGYVQTQQVQLVARLTEELRSTVFSDSSVNQKRPDYSKTLLTENTELGEFLKGLPNLPEVNTTSPELNPYAYLGYIMHTLADLGGLADGVDNLHRRLELDLKSLINTTTQQVIKDLKVTPESIARAKKGQTLLGQFKQIDQNALSILAKAAFARLAKVLEAQRVVSEVAHLYGIVYNFESVCDSILATVKDFLLKYIGGSTAPRPPKNSSFPKDGDSAPSFTRSLPGNKSLFEFGPGDENSKSLRDFEALRESLKKSVPGLLADDPYQLFAETREKQKLDIVAAPHILNIRSLLEPSAALLARAKSLAKTDEYRQHYDRFLEGFIQKNFVPKLQESFEKAIVGISVDAAALEQMCDYQTKSQLPIMNCAAQFAETIGLLSQILDTGTGFRAEYADMLIGLIESVYSFFQTQVTNLFDQANTINPGANRGSFKLLSFINQPLLKNALEKRLKGSPDSEREFSVYFSKRFGANKPSKSSILIQDLLDVNVFREAALLVTSIRWFVLRLQKMRQVDTAETTSKNDDDISVRVRRRWTLLDASTSSSSAHDVTLINSKAVLSGKSLANFDNAVMKLEKCSETALASLRVDLFLRIVWYFDQMVISRDYHTTNRGEERDPVVDRLQQELSTESLIFEEHLLASDYAFLLDDMAGFMAKLFILEGENIKDMNESGQNQILTNIFALQQMLTSIVSDPRDVDFSDSSSFYELFRLNPTLIIDKVREGQIDLGYEDLKLLLEIRHRNASSTTSSHAFGTLADHLSQLDAIFKSQQTGISNGMDNSSVHGTPRSPALVAAPASPSQNSHHSTVSTATSYSNIESTPRRGTDNVPNIQQLRLRTPGNSRPTSFQSDHNTGRLETDTQDVQTVRQVATKPTALPRINVVKAQATVEDSIAPVTPDKPTSTYP